MSTKIVYLDQNKWIALAKAAKNPDEKSEVRSALEFLVNERKAGRVLLPLTATNVYETHKINIVLSGTHAPLGMRLKVAKEFLASDEPAKLKLGVKALEAMMQSDHFSSPYSFDFGARSRDYGFHPKTGNDVGVWFEEVLKVVEPFVVADGPVATRLRKAMTRQFRGLSLHAPA
jgi:hypothetical protein